MTWAPHGRTPGASRHPVPLLPAHRASAWSQVRRAQPPDPVEDAAEQLAGHRDLGHLEHEVTPVGHDLGADLHHLLPQGGQRPPFHLPWQGQGPKEVGQVVGQRMKLSRTAFARKVVHDSRVHLTAFLPSLIHCSAVPRPL